MTPSGTAATSSCSTYGATFAVVLSALYTLFTVQGDWTRVHVSTATASRVNLAPPLRFDGSICKTIWVHCPCMIYQPVALDVLLIMSHILPGAMPCHVLRSSFFSRHNGLPVRHVHRDQMLLDPTKPAQTAATTVYPLDTADEAALHPEAKTLAVLQHNGFSARLVRAQMKYVQPQPTLGCPLRRIAACVMGTQCADCADTFRPYMTRRGDRVVMRGQQDLTGCCVAVQTVCFRSWVSDQTDHSEWMDLGRLCIDCAPGT